jgi:hypothetical protein
MKKSRDDFEIEVSLVEVVWMGMYWYRDYFP